MSDALTSLSDALAGRVDQVAGSLVCLCPGERAQRSAYLWQDGVAITSEQNLPRETEVAAMLPGGRQVRATVVGRDPGTNVAVLRLELPGAARAEPGTAVVGGLVLAIGAAEGRPTVRLGVVHRVGPAWDSMAGGQLDHFIQLDLPLSGREEGGPVLAADGGLLGMSTLGPRRRAIVIPAATIARVLPSLLADGTLQQGWLGLGLQPVGLPPSLRETVERETGLMVISLAPSGPAEQAGVLPGDILLDVAGEVAPDPRAVARALSGEQVGKSVTLRLLRGGEPLALQAVVALRPAA